MDSKKDSTLSERIVREVDLIIWSGKLSELYRFKSRQFWEEENSDREYAKKIEGSPRLESVADHSWHMADTILLIGPNFQPLDIGKCLAFAVLHDKLEIIMDDRDAVGRGGTGERSHAFNADLRRRKDALERDALDSYTKKLRGEARRRHRSLFIEYMDGETREARFVRAIDKLDTLTFILRRKRGNMKDAHLRFTLKYARTSLALFPELEPYFEEFSRRLVSSVAKFRRVPVGDIERVASEDQLEIPLIF